MIMEKKFQYRLNSGVSSQPPIDEGSKWCVLCIALVKCTEYRVTCVVRSRAYLHRPPMYSLHPWSRSIITSHHNNLFRTPDGNTPHLPLHEDSQTSRETALRVDLNGTNTSVTGDPCAAASRAAKNQLTRLDVQLGLPLGKQPNESGYLLYLGKV